MNSATIGPAISRFDEENARDPNMELENGIPCPRELFFARRLSEWVLRLEPQASDPLRLASRCQHICRWMIPRDSYPMTRPGYLKWRQDLKQFHAQKAGEILQELGYPPEIIARVRSLNLKENLRDPETQTLEDALCLVFLEHQLGPLMDKADDGKVVNALRKSWGKMSERGRAAALNLSLPERQKEFLNRALTERSAGL
jgi:hypothetical protein